MDNSAPWLTGQLLLALPGVGDPRFDHAVIAMVSHGPDGAMGVSIGQPLAGISMGDILAQLGIAAGAIGDRPVLSGGPVERQRGFVLHSRDQADAADVADAVDIADAVDVAGQWMLSSSQDLLRALAQGRGPKHWHFILGYAGWDAGQLESEFARHAWHAAPASEALLFATPPAERWTAAFASVGVDARLLSAAGGAA